MLQSMVALKKALANAFPNFQCARPLALLFPVYNAFTDCFKCIKARSFLEGLLFVNLLLAISCWVFSSPIMGEECIFM